MIAARPGIELRPLDDKSDALTVTPPNHLAVASAVRGTESNDLSNDRNVRAVKHSCYTLKFSLLVTEFLQYSVENWSIYSTPTQFYQYRAAD